MNRVIVVAIGLLSCAACTVSAGNQLPPVTVDAGSGLLINSNDVISLNTNEVPLISSGCAAGQVVARTAAGGWNCIDLANGGNGATGATGPTGAMGPTGPQGSLGMEGPAGPTGPQGPPGVTGPQGIQGSQGAQGTQGPAGTAGQSVVGAALSVGDIHCAEGGVSYTAANGVAYVCNGATGDAGVISADGPLQLSNGVLSIATASTLATGVLSSADYETFSSKLSAVLPGAGLIDAGYSAGVETLAVNFGSGASQAVAGNDSRLSDARTPTGGSTLYIQNGPATAESASINITGSVSAASLASSGAVSGTNGNFSGVITAADFAGVDQPGTILDMNDRFLAQTVGTTWTQLSNGRTVLNFANNAYLNLGNSQWLYPTGSATVEAWFATTATAGAIFSNWWGSQWRGLNLYFENSTGSGPTWRFYIGNDTPAFDYVESPSAYNDGSWHHIAAVYDQQNLVLALYIDGAVVASHSTPIFPLGYGSNGSNYASISGVQNAMSAFWTGQVDGFRLFARAFTATEILARYNLTKGRYPGH